MRGKAVGKEGISPSYTEKFFSKIFMFMIFQHSRREDLKSRWKHRSLPVRMQNKQTAFYYLIYSFVGGSFRVRVAEIATVPEVLTGISIVAA